MKQKRVLAALLAATMCMSVPVWVYASETEDGPLGKYPETIELTVFKNYAGSQYLEGEDIDNNVWTRAYEEELGIKLKHVVAVSGDEYKQKLTMAIASDDLPDLMYLPISEYYDLAEAGKLADLTEVFETYSSDILKNAYASETAQSWIDNCKVDGRLYGIPQPANVISTTDLIWVREDWMKNLNLEEPKSIDDVIEMARAFKFNDPDGNGEDDTYGIGFQNNITGQGGSYNGSFEGFFAGFGTYSRAWLMNEEGTVEYTGIDSAMKDALTTLNAMYEEGLIDPEFVVKDSGKLAEDIAAGKVGLFYGREGMAWNDCKNNILNNPDADWVCYPIVNTEGELASPVMYTNLDVIMAVNADCEHPEALIKLTNLFNEKINSAESTLETLDEFGVDPETGINFASYNAFGADPPDKNSMYAYEVQQVFAGEVDPSDIHPEATRYYRDMKEYVDSGFDKAAYPNGWNYYKFIGPDSSWDKINKYYIEGDRLVSSLFFGLPTKTMSLSLADLDKLQAETFTNIITGNAPVDSFDTFVEQWKSMGGDMITEEVNEWYAKTFS